MNRTIGDSNNDKDGITIVAGSTFTVTEKTLEIPPKKQVYEIITSYIEENGNIEISTGNSILKENGEIKLENNTSIMIDPKLFLVVEKYQKEKEEQNNLIKRYVGKEVGE